MRILPVVMVGCLLCGSSFAQTPATRKSQAADKNLDAAAKTSFTKKCVTDAVGG